MVTGLMRVSYVSGAILCPGTSSVFRFSLGGSSLGRVARGKGPFFARQFPRESRPREGPELSQLWGQGHGPFACGHVIIGLRGERGPEIVGSHQSGEPTPSGAQQLAHPYCIWAIWVRGRSVFVCGQAAVQRLTQPRCVCVGETARAAGVCSCVCISLSIGLPGLGSLHIVMSCVLAAATVLDRTLVLCVPRDPCFLQI